MHCKVCNTRIGPGERTCPNCGNDAGPGARLQPKGRTGSLPVSKIAKRKAPEPVSTRRSTRSGK